MSDKTKPSGKGQKQPFDKNHPNHPDYTGDNARGILLDKADADTHHQPSPAEQQHERDRHAEQQLKQQEHQQDERNAFQPGNAQEHQQGNKQR